jgi:hypothetical protein
MIEISGPEALERLSRRLKDVGAGISQEGSLRKELSQAIMKSTAPLKIAIPESADKSLPRHGGLNRDIAGSKITTRRRTYSRGTGVRVETRNAYAIGKINQGHVRHRVYGHNVWVTQEVTPGFWDRPIKEIGPAVRVELEVALNKIVKRIG